MNQEIRKVIKEKALKYGIDPDLIEAFCLVESSDDPDAERFEPDFKKRYIDYMKLDNEEAEGRATSYGLMQIMGQVARELGFKGQFSELFTPEIGLEYSIRHLKHFIDKYNKQGMNHAIAAYNAGSARIKGGLFVNQGYVDKVNKALNKIKGRK